MFFDIRDKCRKPGFLRGNIYTSCISMVLLDYFANKSNTFQHTLSLCPPLSLPLSLSHFLPFPPLVSTSSYSEYQDTVIKGTLVSSCPNLIIIILYNDDRRCHLVGEILSSFWPFYSSNKRIEYLFGNILSSFGPHYMMIIILVSIFASFSSEMSKVLN